MRKRQVLLLILMLALGLSAGVTQAQPAERLTGLASYFPQNTLVYAAIRTDPGFIETLDGVVGLVSQNLGELMPQPLSVTDVLDLVTFGALGSSYDDSVATWLGDSVGVGLFSFNVSPGDQVRAVIAAQIKDRAGAEAFFSGLFPNYQQSAGDGYTLYESGPGLDAIIVTDDVALVGLAGGLVLNAYNGVGGSLGESAEFASAIEALPGDSYSLLVYADGQRINEASLNMLRDQMRSTGVDIPGLNTLMQMSSQNAVAAGSAAAGFSIIDGRTLAVDFAGILSDEALDMLKASPGYLDQNPITLDFAAHIPGNAQLVMHDNAFGPDLLAIFDLLDAVAPALEEVIDAFATNPQFLRELDLDVDPALVQQFAEMLDLSGIKLGGILKNQLTPLVAGFTGLNLEDDILAWMTGDYATWLRVIPVDSELNFSVDLGFVTANTDPDAAAYIVSRLAEASDLYGVAYSDEEIGGGRAIGLVAPIRGPLGYAVDPETLLATPELDLVVGSNDDVFVFSTRPGAEFALNPGEDSLLNNAAFVYAAENAFLPDTVLVWYVNPWAMADAVTPLSDRIGEQTAQQVAFALRQVENLSLTGSFTNENSTVIRLSITIPESVPPMGETALSTTHPAVVTKSLIPAGAVARYAGVPQFVTEEGFPALGSSDAPFLVEVYSSVGCPHCKMFHDAAIDDIIALATSGDIAFVFIPMTPGYMSHTETANRAAMCLVEDGLFWAYHDALFSWQEITSEFVVSDLLSAAAELGADPETLRACMDGDGAKVTQAAAVRYQAAGVTGTPTLFVNGERLQAASLETLQAALDGSSA